MSDNTNQEALLAAKDQQKRTDFINKHEQVILKTASINAKKYISKSDDEWSIALLAFSKAIDVYSIEKGDFLPFALMLVKRALIDYYRGLKKDENIVSISPHVINGNNEPEEDTLSFNKHMARKAQDTREDEMREEILEATNMLKPYKITFYELSESSPKQDKSRQECAL